MSQLDDVYAQMLRDVGVNVQQSVTPQVNVQQSNYNICCGQVQDNIHDGHVVCYDCGKVFRGAVAVYYSSFKDTQMSSYGRGNQSNDGIEFKKKRFYKSSSHFREHLRRYLGCRVQVPESAMNIIRQRISDFTDPMAYFKVKNVLKELGLPQYYRSIFTVIYKCGGIKPNLSVQVIQKSEQQFLSLAHYFQQHRGVDNKFRRKSMPSMYMMLDLILRRCGHQPHYFIPQLKDRELRQKVLDFYVQYDVDEFHCTSQQRSIPTDAQALVQMYPDLPVLCDRLGFEQQSSKISCQQLE